MRISPRALHQRVCRWRRLVLVIPGPPCLPSLGLALLAARHSGREVQLSGPRFYPGESCPTPSRAQEEEGFEL